MGIVQLMKQKNQQSMISLDVVEMNNLNDIGI